MSVQSIELLNTPEVVSEGEVADRFNEIVANIDGLVGQEAEEALGNTLTRKVGGSGEAFSMWRP